MIAWLVVALQAAQGPAPVPLSFTAVPRCEQGSAEEIVVCAARRDRYRLPLPEERALAEAPQYAGTGMAALTPAAPCGIFAGERRCGSREALAHSYGGGRDPVTLLGKVAGAIAAGPE